MKGRSKPILRGWQGSTIFAGSIVLSQAGILMGQGRGCWGHSRDTALCWKPGFAEAKQRFQCRAHQEAFSDRYHPGGPPSVSLGGIWKPEHSWLVHSLHKD